MLMLLRCRMDKFLYLIRQYLHASFQSLARRARADPQIVEQYAQVLGTTPLNSADAKLPNGLRYHVLDIFVDELEELEPTEAERNKAELCELLLKPVRKLAKRAKDGAIRRAANEVLRDERLSKWKQGQESTEKAHVSLAGGGDEGDEEAEWGGISD